MNPINPANALQTIEEATSEQKVLDSLRNDMDQLFAALQAFQPIQTETDRGRHVDHEIKNVQFAIDSLRSALLGLKDEVDPLHRELKGEALDAWTLAKRQQVVRTYEINA